MFRYERLCSLFPSFFFISPPPRHAERTPARDISRGRSHKSARAHYHIALRYLHARTSTKFRVCPIGCNVPLLSAVKSNASQPTGSADGSFGSAYLRYSAGESRGRSKARNTQPARSPRGAYVTAYCYETLGTL